MFFFFFVSEIQIINEITRVERDLNKIKNIINPCVTNTQLIESINHLLRLNFISNKSNFIENFPRYEITYLSNEIINL